VIVVDNASKDGTKEEITKLKNINLKFIQIKKILGSQKPTMSA